MEGSHQEQAHSDDEEQEIKELQGPKRKESLLGTFSYRYNHVLVWRIEEYSRKKKPEWTLKSPEFYTGSPGYKLRAYLSLIGPVKEYICIKSRLLFGPADDQLHWPVRLTIKYSILPQDIDGDPIVFERTSEWLKKPVLGCIICEIPQLIKSEEVENENYIVDDVFFIKIDITNIEVRQD